MNKKINYKNLLILIPVLILTLYIPLTFTIYSQNWYEFNYNLQDTYQVLNESQTNKATTNLINYFKYKEELNEQWTDKEKIHYKEVRNIYTKVHLLALFSLITLILNKIEFKKKKKEYIKNFNKISLTNIKIVSTLILILPIFGFFWSKIFHSIMFDNKYWIMEPHEISAYLFDLSFFLNSTILIIIISILLNYILFKTTKSFLNKN